MPGPHLSDDQLSALLDGDGEAAGPASAAHVSHCPACATRLDRFRAVAAAIAVPVTPLPAEMVDRLVAGALTAGSSARRGTPSIDAARSRRNRWAPATAARAAVAAVLVLLLGVPLVVGGLGNRGDRDSEAAIEATGGGPMTASDGRAANAAGPEPLSAGTTAAMGGVTTGAAGAAPGVLGAIATEDDLVARLIAEMSTTRTVADMAASGGEESTAAAPAAPAVAFPCADQASSAGVARLGEPIFTGSLIWRDIDAVVHVFLLSEPVDGLTRQAYVMARADCRVLAEPRF